ncbi:MAG: undecaprenyl-phosphate glucose phosphotransferase [Lachnospiraceae bacterium]|nr:undecaprenyl-phosphate glucose phosphotransferase [Lachnospiraceae bacterium]
MIRERQNLFNYIQVLLDAAVTALSYGLAYLLVFHSPLTTGSPALSLRQYFLPLIAIVPVMILLYSVFQLYTPRRVMGRRLEAFRIFQANAIGVLLFMAILFLGGDALVRFSRRVVGYFGFINVVLEVAERLAVRYVLRSMRARGLNQKHVLLVGYSQAAEGYIDRVRMNPQWGYQVRGILDDTMERGTEYKGVRVLGPIADLEVILPFNRLDEIAITLGLAEYEKLGHIVAACEKSGVHTKFVPDYGSILPTRPYTEDIQGLPVINIRNVPLNDGLNAFVKRTMDIFGALVAIVIFSPVMLATAIAIKLTSPGPIIFKQERVGRHSRPFQMFKFRSMEIQEPEDEEKEWTTKNDPRVTPIGKFIRRTSIDEMPQFFNILKGDMSLVGPRPERPFFVEKFREEVPRYMVKHQVRPGLTGWAQVNGFRGDTSIRRRIEMDLYYIENWTLGFDFKILFLTFFKGFVNKNAY